METNGKLIQIPEGTTILKEGELNLDMYKIISGHAEVYMAYGTDRETLIGIIGPQSCFGEFGLLLEKPAIYTVIAYSDVVLMRITKGEMGDFVKENHRNIMQIMENMAQTMLTMKSQIDLLVDDINNGVKLNDRTIHEIRKTFGSAAIYRNSAMTGEFHSRLRDRKR